MTNADQLSRREREIMDILYRLEQASAKNVMDAMKEAPSYSSVRTLLGKLVEKGHADHKEVGRKYIYFPIVEHERASQSALSNVMKTFFGDSPYLAANALLDMSIHELSEDELDRLEELIKSRKAANDGQAGGS